MALRSFSDYRVLIVPGLHNSGPEHWQSRWQRLYPQFERVEQDDWNEPDLATWSARLDQVRRQDARPTLIVAHSFGCLATAHSLARDPRGVAGVLLVGPADPDKFGVAKALPQKRLPCPGILIVSQTDPWMTAEHAAQWARRWNCKYIDGGALGHINAESRLGDWVYGQAQLQTLFDLAQGDKRHRQAA